MDFDTIDRLAETLKGHTDRRLAVEWGYSPGIKNTAFGETDYAVWADSMRGNAMATDEIGRGHGRSCRGERALRPCSSFPAGAGAKPNFGSVSYRSAKVCVSQVVLQVRWA